jgi:hypothetical protein
MRMKWFMVAAAALCATAGGVLADDAAIDAKLVADQVRNQGLSCKDPVSATRDEAASKPELPVYVLTCADATYNVKVVPDQAWVITKQ